MPSIAYYTAAFPPVSLTPKTTTAANEGVAWGGVVGERGGVGGAVVGDCFCHFYLHCLGYNE